MSAIDILLILDLEGSDHSVPTGGVTTWSTVGATPTVGIVKRRQRIPFPASTTPPQITLRASDDPELAAPVWHWFEEALDDTDNPAQPYGIQLLIANGLTQRLGELRRQALATAPPPTPAAAYTPLTTFTAHTALTGTAHGLNLVGTLLGAVARGRVAVGGTLIGTRRSLNLIPGTNVTLTAADNAGTEAVDVTIAAAGGGSSTLAGATDYDNTIPATVGQAIIHNGTKFAPGTDSAFTVQDPSAGAVVRSLRATLTNLWTAISARVKLQTAGFTAQSGLAWLGSLRLGDAQAIPFGGGNYPGTLILSTPTAGQVPAGSYPDGNTVVIEVDDGGHLRVLDNTGLRHDLFMRPTFGIRSLTGVSGTQAISWDDDLVSLMAPSGATVLAVGGAVLANAGKEIVLTVADRGGQAVSITYPQSVATGTVTLTVVKNWAVVRLVYVRQAGISSYVVASGYGFILAGTNDDSLTVSATANGDAYFPAPTPLTFGSVTYEAGIGTISYSKALAASPTVFSATSLPITLAAGDVLKITVSSISGYKAVTLARTA